MHYLAFISATVSSSAPFLMPGVALINSGCQWALLLCQNSLSDLFSSMLINENSGQLPDIILVKKAGNEPFKRVAVYTSIPSPSISKKGKSVHAGGFLGRSSETPRENHPHDHDPRQKGKQLRFQRKQKAQRRNLPLYLTDNYLARTNDILELE